MAKEAPQVNKCMTQDDIDTALKNGGVIVELRWSDSTDEADSFVECYKAEPGNIIKANPGYGIKVLGGTGTNRSFFMAVLVAYTPEARSVLRSSKMSALTKRVDEEVALVAINVQYGLDHDVAEYAQYLVPVVATENDPYSGHNMQSFQSWLRHVPVQFDRVSYQRTMTALSIAHEVIRRQKGTVWLQSIIDDYESRRSSDPNAAVYSSMSYNY
jgi:hypothetical protein